MAGYQQLKGGKEITLTLKMGFISGSRKKVISHFRRKINLQSSVLTSDFK